MNFSFLFLLNRVFADAAARADCLTIMPTWEGPHSGPSITPTDPKFGTFSGPSTRCHTNPPLDQHHDYLLSLRIKLTLRRALNTVRRSTWG